MNTSLEMKSKLFELFDNYSNRQMVDAINYYARFCKYAYSVIEIEVDYDNDQSIISIDAEYFDRKHELYRLIDVNDLIYDLIDSANAETLADMIACFRIEM